MGHWRYIHVVQRWKSEVRFCFIFNVGSKLFQRWSTTLKQRWSDLEMLDGRYRMWYCNTSDTREGPRSEFQEKQVYKWLIVTSEPDSILQCYPPLKSGEKLTFICKSISVYIFDIYVYWHIYIYIYIYIDIYIYIMYDIY